MKNISIKVKLVLLFILIKVIPLLLIAYIAYEGALELEKYVQKSTKYLFNQNKEIVLNTANASIEDSIKNLDKKSQLSLERVSFEIANNVADFLYERDRNLLFLSQINLNQEVIERFYKSNKKDIIIHDKYTYNEKTNTWEAKEKLKKEKRETRAQLKDNEKEFNFTDPYKLNKKSIPIYKEINYFDLKGKEIYKVSQINTKLVDISKKENTYVNAEDYFNSIQNLKKGEIYVSNVIGEYVKSNVIGTFTKAKAQKLNIEFEPEKHAYAGKENPNGKKFEGIIRFVTPVFKNNIKIGYISLALDHEHIMQFTDTSNPTDSNVKQNISDASVGNYAFMWDYIGRNISHPRDYFIAGFDKETGERAMPWLSADIASKFKESKSEINEFLANYPTFEEQSLKKKPNIPQLLKDGNIGLDCRYLNFAPQCQGWMQVTQNGGYGSFVIYWSKVWKLTTAATIPYYTGQYGKTKRGFGFVTIGANIDEFHAAANETKRSVNKILNTQTKHMEEIVEENSFEIQNFIDKLINELSVFTFMMILLVIGVAIWMSNYISGKIEKLLIGTQKFANNDFDYKIDVKSKDEIGNLENSFNVMASRIKTLIQSQKELNEHLEEKVNEKTSKLTQINKNLENQIEERTNYLKETLQKAQKADEAKSTFLANMSHEIRTPLNAILGFSDILCNNKELDSQAYKQAKIIQSSGNTLLEIINDILDLSKIESGNFDINIEETNIHFISEHVIELFSKKALEKNIKLVFNLDLNVPPCILTDGVRIRQVLSNLLSNAIKFTPEKGTVELNIKLVQIDDEKVLRVEVVDNGIGIDEDKKETIFAPFIQIDNSSNRKYEGTGLGLSICSHIIESFGSKIQLESNINKGSKFWFDLEFKECKETQDFTNYLKQINFITLNNNSYLYNNIKKYLHIFEEKSNESNSSLNIDIYVHDFKNKNLSELDDIRKNNPNIPKLILVEYDNDLNKAHLSKNEITISLPFYASKVNDTLQDLLKNSDTQESIDTKPLEEEHKGKVLIAEDNLTNQELIKYIFSSMNLDFTIANDGLEAINYRKENNYDLIFMDINMPNIDGIESFKQIREFEEKNNKKQIPIVALTANAIKGDKEKFLELGMNEYLSKPINTNSLNEILNKYLKDTDIEEKIEQKDNTIEKQNLDIKKIAENLSISENIALMIVNNFKKSIVDDLNELENYIKNDDKENISSKAHYIKNSCLNIGLNEACEILQKLESETLDNNRINELFIELKKQINLIN